MDELLLAGVSLISKIGEMIARAKEAQAEQHAAIVAAFRAAEAALAGDQAAARAAVTAEEAKTEAVIDESTKP